MRFRLPWRRKPKPEPLWVPSFHQEPRRPVLRYVLLAGFAAAVVAAIAALSGRKPADPRPALPAIAEEPRKAPRPAAIPPKPCGPKVHVRAYKRKGKQVKEYYRRCPER